MPIIDIVTEWVGAPSNSLESALLYAGAVISFVIVFDTVVGIFRLVANILHRPA
jgi:hypothetical protein